MSLADPGALTTCAVRKRRSKPRPGCERGRAMPFHFEDATARVSKVFERLEGAPSDPMHAEPPTAASFKQPSPGPVPPRPNAYQHRDARLQAGIGELRPPRNTLRPPHPGRACPS